MRLRGTIFLRNEMSLIKGLRGILGFLKRQLVQLDYCQMRPNCKSINTILGLEATHQGTCAPGFARVRRIRNEDLLEISASCRTEVQPYIRAYRFRVRSHPALIWRNGTPYRSGIFVISRTGDTSRDEPDQVERSRRTEEKHPCESLVANLNQQPPRGVSIGGQGIVSNSLP